MRAGFKRSRTRARVYSLYFRSLCGSIIDQSKSWRNFSSGKGEESKFFEESFFFFHRRSIWTIWKEKENGEGRILSGTRLDCSLPPPLPSPLLPWKTEALSLSPPSHRDNDIGERASPPPPPVHPFLSSSSSSSVGALGPLRPLAAALFPIRLLDYLRAFGGSGQGPMMRSGIEYRLAL